MAVITRQPDDPQPVAPIQSAEAGKADQVPSGYNDAGQADDPYGEEIDLGYWITCMDDAERAEGDWRKRGRQVVQIYRNEEAAAKTKTKTDETTFNILYANTEVLLGAVYQKPPQPVVRSRFASANPIPMAPPPLPPPPELGGPPTGLPGAPPTTPPGGLLGETAPTPFPPGGEAPPIPGAPPLGPTPLGPPEGGPLAAPPGALPPGPPGLVPPVAPPEASPFPAGPPGGASPMPIGMPGGMPSLGPPPGPQQKDIETAAAVIEKALEIVVDDEHSHEAVKTAIKDVLLPGRGVARVRWKPQMKAMPVQDPVMGGQLNLPGQPNTPQSTEQKVWEEVNDEYVFWEDLLLDPVRQAADTDWIAFRHLFTEHALKAEFAGNPKFDAIVAAGKINELLLWTDESAAKHVVGGGSASKTATKLGGHRRKAMVWEVWDRITRKIIWLIRDGAGLVLRVDPDSMMLAGFFPIPIPMLAVTTSDSRIPRAYYNLYSKLAGTLDRLADRIDRLIDKIKVRGAYNSASKDIADILVAEDGKMLPVAGVDMLNGGLQNHIWLVPIKDWIMALQQLYLAANEIKQMIYEIMGISDIMRGATKATETATAQRIKGSMGVSRLEDMKGIASNFVRDLLRLKAEVICKNFSPETLSKMTGEDVTPQVMEIIRSDFNRTCSIDIESDSTVAPDEAVEQESMAMVMTAIGTIMGGAQQMLATGIMPAPQVMQLSLELIKMALHPVRYSRPVVELINTYQEQLEQVIAMGAQFGVPPMGPQIAPPMPPGAGPGGPPGRSATGGGGPPKANGAGRPPIAGAPPSPELAM